MKQARPFVYLLVACILVLLGVLWAVPLFIVGLWWISVPVYYALLGVEFVSVGRLKQIAGGAKALQITLFVQICIPFATFAFYPLMPGSALSGDPGVWMTDKLYYAIYVTFVFAIAGFIVFKTFRRLTLRRCSREAEQSSPPYRSQAREARLQPDGER